MYSWESFLSKIGNSEKFLCVLWNKRSYRWSRLKITLDSENRMFSSTYSSAFHLHPRGMTSFLPTLTLSPKPWLCYSALLAHSGMMLGEREKNVLKIFLCLTDAVVNWINNFRTWHIFKPVSFSEYFCGFS